MKKEIKQQITSSEINELENWLIEEQRKSRAGFYDNWHTIKQSINSNRAFFLIYDNTIAGFLTYYGFEKVVEIVLTEIKPNLRGKGLGGYLFTQCKEKFFALGYRVAHLECMPRSSQTFWRKAGFVDIPQPEWLKSLYIQEEVKLYRPLIEAAEICNISEDVEVIELWDDEPKNIASSTPTWTWTVNYLPLTNRLDKPIIHPSRDHWKLRWRKGNTIYFEKRVKEFKNQDIYCNGFIIIEAL